MDNHPSDVKSTQEVPIKRAFKTRIKDGLRRVRKAGWTQIAGPALSPIGSWLATLPLDKATTQRVDAENARYWAAVRRSIPINLLGGYAFPDAPMLEIGLDKYLLATEAVLVTEHVEKAPPLQPWEPTFIGDHFDIPAFLVRR